MTTMSDLPDDLAEEILSRVPLTSLCAVRSTCKKWDALSKNRIFGKSAAVARRKQFLGFMMKDYRVCSFRFDLQGIRDEGDFVGPSIKQVSILDQVEISQVFCCDGLLLCVTKDNSRLLVWNPYLGQTRWIQPRNNIHSEYMYAIGYDKNHNHKILRIFTGIDDYESTTRYMVLGYKIYDLNSNSWKVFNINSDWHIDHYQPGVSLKGNTYFLAGEKTSEVIQYIISFDYTTERFGQRLTLPFNLDDPDKFVSLCCVREEQLAVLHQKRMNGYSLEIWVTNKIDPAGSVSWSKFLRSISCWKVDLRGGSFFIDEEKKVAFLFSLGWMQTRHNQRASIIGQDEYFKSVNMGKAIVKNNKFGKITYCPPLVCSSSYVPSLVQLQINQPGKCKEGCKSTNRKNVKKTMINHLHFK